MMAQEFQTGGSMMECYDPLESPPPEEWLDMDEAEFSASSRTIIVRTIPSAFVSVSLSAASPDPSYLELRDCVEGLERDTLWRPGVVHHAAEAMPFSAYGFFTKSALMVRP
jgi:menaquinone-dependent protoporphyrinogen IX oxidase